MISARTARIDDNLGRGTDGSNPLPSGSQSVSLVPSAATGTKGPAFAANVSLDETRERDMLATNRLALALFPLTGIDAVPPFGKTKTLNEKMPGLGLDTLYRGSLFN